MQCCAVQSRWWCDGGAMPRLCARLLILLLLLLPAAVCRVCRCWQVSFHVRGLVIVCRSGSSVQLTVHSTAWTLSHRLSSSDVRSLSHRLVVCCTAPHCSHLPHNTSIHSPCRGLVPHITPGCSMHCHTTGPQCCQPELVTCLARRPASSVVLCPAQAHSQRIVKRWSAQHGV